MRCLHLDRTARQCPVEALQGSDFCAGHGPVLDAEAPEARLRVPFVYRLAALLLLLTFLFNAYQTVRAWLV